MKQLKGRATSGYISSGQSKGTSQPPQGHVKTPQEIARPNSRPY